jgi:prepilin-type processing-associated H-X9-DG protein
LADLPGKGDIPNNGAFQNLVQGNTATKLEVNDGSATTIMLSENIQKDNGYSWMGTQAGIAEQYFGMVWVVNLTPAPGNTNYDQVGIGKEATPIVSNGPWYARPGSSHPVGTFNVVFLDGHTRGMRPDIDYAVYQSLLTANGRKCDDPAMHRGADTMSLPPADPIRVFRTRAPLSETDYGD